jgi:hypothetical protein
LDRQSWRGPETLVIGTEGKNQHIRLSSMQRGGLREREKGRDVMGKVNIENTCGTDW